MPLDLQMRYSPTPLRSQRHTVMQTKKYIKMGDVLLILFLNWASTRGIFPTIHALSQYILPTASHIYPSFPLRMMVDYVFYHEADQLLLCVPKMSPWGDIFKLSHNHCSISCLTAAIYGSDIKSGSVWGQISHWVDVIPSGLAPNLSPRGGFDLSP